VDKETAAATKKELERELIDVVNKYNSLLQKEISYNSEMRSIGNEIDEMGNAIDVLLKSLPEYMIEMPNRNRNGDKTIVLYKKIEE
jgi:hypothetical protein